LYFLAFRLSLFSYSSANKPLGGLARQDAKPKGAPKGA